MKRMFYYARLNSDNVCVGFASYPTLMKDVEGLVHLADYNETYLYKKYDFGLKAFSQETFEPSIPLELQGKIDYLEGVVATQNTTLENLNATNTSMINTMQMLEGTIMELTSMLASLQGGTV